MENIEIEIEIEVTWSLGDGLSKSIILLKHTVKFNYALILI